MPRPPRMDRPTKRMTLEMPVSQWECIQRLRDKTKADSCSEVIRHSLSFYEFLVNCGGTVIVRDKKGEREIVVL